MTNSTIVTEHTFKVMGGPARLVIEHAPDHAASARVACQAVEALLRDLEARYSRYREDSLISQINRLAGTGKLTTVDEETLALLEFCERLWEQSQGLFDPTAGILRQVWDFSRGQQGDVSELPNLLGKVSWTKVVQSEEGIALSDAGMELDFGGIVKEYGADKAAQSLRDSGFNHALIELAGDIVAVGNKCSGAPWQVGISDPDAPSETLVTIELSNCALATSGDYQRFIEINGRRYSHFLNPHTGWPVEGAASVSVISDSCLTAGAVATVACLNASEGATAWLTTAGLPWLRVEQAGECSGPLALAHPADAIGRN
ncbi:MAG: FAD:protein FMN transferase [Luminiphilus sp.]|nr:FAD:protein FMN transferase [Luminiphilus sp.]